MKPVSLDHLVEAIASDPAEGAWYLRLNSGQLHRVPHPIFNAIVHRPLSENDLTTAPENVAVAMAILSDDGNEFLKLPGQLDVLEWDAMRRFVEILSKESFADELRKCVHGPNAFRDFSKFIRRHGLEAQWLEFKQDAARSVAIQWCEEHNVPYKE